MHLWRNRQTRQIQVLVGATRCRFDSCQVHQKSAKLKRVLPIFTFSLFTFHSSLKIFRFWEVISNSNSEEVLVGFCFIFFSK